MAIGNVANAVPVGVFPHSLARRFSRRESMLTRQNRYVNGELQSGVLVATPRWEFVCEYALTAAQSVEFRDFYLDHNGILIPFHFYVLEETSPRWSTDATGASASGRYVMRFASALDISFGVGTLRAGASFSLIQLA